MLEDDVTASFLSTVLFDVLVVVTVGTGVVLLLLDRIHNEPTKTAANTTVTIAKLVMIDLFISMRD